MVHTSRSYTNARTSEPEAIKRAKLREADGDHRARPHMGFNCGDFILERGCSSFLSAALDLCSRERVPNRHELGLILTGTIYARSMCSG
jgi:hypothetical protein